MGRLREDYIHFAIRQFLRESDWQLVAGEYPNGSDDELPRLNIMDPLLARDNSPDHRRHSKNKLVPDLVAYKDQIIFLVEMKPKYSYEDEKKLLDILEVRYDDLLAGMDELTATGRVTLPVAVSECIFVPCLGFSHESAYPRKNKFCYFLVRGLNSVVFVGNSIVPKL